MSAASEISQSAVSSRSSHLLHHDVALGISTSPPAPPADHPPCLLFFDSGMKISRFSVRCRRCQRAAPQTPASPARTSHLMRAHIFLVHVTGHNRSLYHRLTISLCRIFGLTNHARVVFITVLHGDRAGASFTLTRSTAIRPTAPGAGFVRFRTLPPLHQQNLMTSSLGKRLHFLPRHRIVRTPSVPAHSTTCFTLFTLVHLSNLTSSTLLSLYPVISFL